MIVSIYLVLDEMEQRMFENDGSATVGVLEAILDPRLSLFGLSKTQSSGEL